MSRAPLLCLLGGVLLAAAAAAAAADESTQQRLDASPAPGARFGSAVAVGDQVLAVGAYLDSAGGTESGAVYLYKRNSEGTWKPMTPQPLASAPGEQFGYSVAIDGNILIVGAPFAQVGGVRSGKVYSFDLTGGEVQQLQLPQIPASPGAEIGCAVAAASRIVAVGACGKGGTGGVYVIQGASALDLHAPAAAGDRLGTAVALSSDGQTLVAGAPLRAGSGPEAGAAYVFSASDWTRPGVPLPATPRPADAFGYAVATDGTNIAVGAPLDDSEGQDAGAVYLFQPFQGGPDWRGRKLDLKSTPGDQLGVSVALDHGTILAGARRHGAQHGGAAYLISTDGTVGNPLLALKQQNGAELGFAVALHCETALVGAFLESSEAGAAYVFAPSVQIVGSPPLHALKSKGFLDVPVSIVTADGQPTRSKIIVGLTCSGAGAVNLQCLPVTFPVNSGSETTHQGKVMIGNATAPGDLHFLVTLTDPNGVFLGSPYFAEALIQDDLHTSAAIETILPTTPLLTSESGRSATFKVRLATRPTSLVTVALASDTLTEGTVSPATLRFTGGNWNLPQTVTVTGVDDTVPDGNVPYSILLATMSDDPAYNGLSAPPVPVVNLDDDLVTGTERACDLGSGQVLFTFVLANHGPAQPEVDLSDSLPAELNAVAASSDAGAAFVDPFANQVVWRTPVAAGAQATLTLVAAVVPGNTGRPVSNQAVFTYDADGDGLNETTRKTDDVDLPGAPLVNRPTTFTIGALRPCPFSTE